MLRVGFRRFSPLSLRNYGSAPSGPSHPEGVDFAALAANPSLRKFSREDVAKHRVLGDAWVVINYHVYNVSSWLEIHPGGREPILEHIGSDATEAWSSAGHSGRARLLMKNYLIGYTEEPTRLSLRKEVVGEMDDANFISPETPEEKFIRDIKQYMIK